MASGHHAATVGRSLVAWLKERRAGALIYVTRGALRVILRSEAPGMDKNLATAIDEVPVIVAAVVLIDQERQRACL